MTISSISDLLAVGWTHAYCTEGPEFVSAIAAASTPGVNAIIVGAVGVGRGPTVPSTVATWPDEVGSDDLVQATAARQPFYNPSSSAMGGRPAIECYAPADNRFMTVDFADIAQPFEVVIVGRARSLSGDRPLFDGLGAGFASLARFSAGTTQWRMSVSSSGSTLLGGTSDTSKHLFRLVTGATDSGVVDEVTVMSGANGTNPLKGVTIGGYAAGSSAVSDADHCFIGIKSGTLTAGERSDIHAFCQSHYGTP